VEIRYERGPQVIKSEDTFLVGYVLFDKMDGYAEVTVVENAQQMIREKIDSGELVVPPGISYRFTGSYENQVRAERTLSVVVPLVLLLGRLLHWPRNVVGALLIVLPLGNTSYLGFPLVQSFFGTAGMPYAMVYDQLGSFLALASYAVVIAAFYSPQVATPSARAIFTRIVSFPPFLALLAGLALRGTTLPPLVEQLVATVAATLVPLVMIAVGFQISIRLARSERLTLAIALGIKLVLMPLCTFILWKALGQRGLATQIAVFQAAMPPMISAGTIAIMAGLAPRLVAGLIGIGILLSLVTLPTLYWLLSQSG